MEHYGKGDGQYGGGYEKCGYQWMITYWNVDYRNVEDPTFLVIHSVM